jgi:RNA polymerase sigma factor (sigma-70 family)
MLRLVRRPRSSGDRDVVRPHDELAALVAGVVRGDAGATRSFVVAVARPVRRAVVMVLGSKDGEVDDASQEAILGVLRALPKFRGECTSTQFVVRIAVLSAVAVRRRRRGKDRWVGSQALDEDDARVDSDSSPLAHVEVGRRRAAIRRLIDELPAPIAEAVVLYFMLGYTVPEIAALSQAPVNTIWSRLRIGRERMRQVLAADTRLGAELGADVEGRR